MVLNGLDSERDVSVEEVSERDVKEASEKEPVLNASRFLFCPGVLFVTGVLPSTRSYTCLQTCPFSSGF